MFKQSFIFPFIAFCKSIQSLVSESTTDLLSKTVFKKYVKDKQILNMENTVLH